MLVTIENVTYQVKWVHNMSPQNKRDKRCTCCMIERVSKVEGKWVRDDSNPRHCEGVVCCAREDQYVKEVGRKLSLAAALANLRVHVQGVDKAFRQTFWSEYFRLRNGRRESLRNRKMERLIAVEVEKTLALNKVMADVGIVTETH